MGAELEALTVILGLNKRVYTQILLLRFKKRDLMFSESYTNPKDVVGMFRLIVWGTVPSA